MPRIAVLCALLFYGCAIRPSHPGVPFTNTAITLVREPLDIRLIQPHETRPVNEIPVLILFATGDGGWRTLDREVFTAIGRQGYPVAGFSASRYLKTMNAVSDSTTPPKLAEDFGRVIEFAEGSMNLPSATTVILVGVSRGAGLSTIASGQTPLQSKVAGVVAIALGEVEEHVVHRQRRAAKTEWVAVETYEYLRQLSDLPIEIIQSTHDKYTTAARARELLGADTPCHHLHPIEAPNHTFRGAVPQVLAQLEESLNHLTAARKAAVR